METLGHNPATFGKAAVRPLWRFRYPHEVVNDTSLSLEDRRAILAAWASDIHAVESFPALRHLPGTPVPVTYSSIMDARILLDRLAGCDADDPGPPPRPCTQRPREYRIAA